jgi:D-alanyl-D-alanine dipeptidase
MNIDETLEAVISTSRLLVEPIWEVPIDKIEGPLYKAYICSGAAIDVDVMDLRTGKLVDFGCPVNTDDEIAGLTTTRLSARQQKNREILQAAMLGAGFASFQSEWWHFSYGDKTWAQFYGLEVPTYGLIDG